MKGYSKRQFWDFSAHDRRFIGVLFIVNDLMTESQFNFITKELFYTSDPSPAYQDKFHSIRELQDAWNANMSFIFLISWFVCLDESMPMWVNKFTCVGFVFCPRKPWPFGNEWHTIACSLCRLSIYFGWNLWRDRIICKRGGTQVQLP